MLRAKSLGLLLCLLLSPFAAQASYIGGAGGGASNIITTATDYYVCAKGAGGTCVYNGDGGTVATPSDSNNCTSKDTPCLTIGGVATLLNGSILANIVTIHLADTAGTGTDCYRPNATIFHVTTVGRDVSSAGGIGTGETGIYPSSYLYVLGNTTTPSNVKVTGATTCAGTTSNDPRGIIFSNLIVRVRGLQFQYFNQGTDLASAAVSCFMCMMYGEDNYGLGDGVAASSVMYSVYKGEISLGNSIQSTITKMSVLSATNEAQVTTITPLGRANLNITVTGWTFNMALFTVNELSHMGIDGMTIAVAGSTTGSGTIYYAIASGSITWNDNSTFTAPAQTHTYNGTGLTLLKAQQGGYIFDACRTVGSLTCTIGTTNAIGTRANASEYSYIRYLTPGTVTTKNSAASFGVIYDDVGMLTGYLNTTFANLPADANGTLRYCSDCTFANPCAGAGTGAFAKRLNGAWRCD